MTKRELVLFLRDLEKVRKMLTPAQAAQVPNLFPKVKEDKEFKKGQKFNLNGKIVEAAQDFKFNKETKEIPTKRFGGR